ncbi:hypothetical protein EDD17DRAFT_99746 [Pisolithus thermaeus]|nr:hypothetical protein EDD17DRAFT_99746 [Pisolithus thermaeus]
MSSATIPTRTSTPTLAITSDDIVILVMGKTESGINNFINKLIEMQPEGTNRLASRRENVREYECFYSGQRFILVDTPGLNDGERLQGTAFRDISKWLEDTYQRSIRLTGVIYTHDVTGNNWSSTDVQSLELLGHLCGNEAADRVRLVTTTCGRVEELDVDNVEGIPGIADWRSFIEAGARLKRFDNTSEGAWRIVEGLENTKKALLLQKELVDRGMRLEDTAAGKHLRLDESAAPSPKGGSNAGYGSPV